ncbi:MAG: hypothetical protein KBT44_06555 [Bacteroidales bacterium]|nr:hypothetical protein [Candidatus Equibacterium intestinale]
MKKHIAIIALIAALACSCDKYYDGYYDPEYYATSKDFLTLRNYSSDVTVWFIPAKENSETLPDELSEWQKISIYEINGQSARTLTFDSEDNYVTPVETYGIDDEMVIYVFKKEIWDAYEWKDLVKGKKWSGKCSLSVKDALESKSVITYPIR